MDIRNIFLDYFKSQDHLILPSAGLIPEDDPSVLLTTAGMQQFKPYYLGIKKPPASRIATVQKCFRTSDIDNIGNTDQHLTFFEMLGNFAFADYFKKEAIDFAMEFLLDILKIDKKRLSVAVFAGDDDIPIDNESVQYWKKWGFESNKIYKYGKCDNFWGPAGDKGPCGPCTEIYYDFGPEFGCKRKECSPECDCDRYLEIWNLVFTQYNFNGETYEELPNKNIDTGLGLERIAAVIEKNPSVFKTGLFADIVNKIEQISGKRLTSEKNSGFNRELNRWIKIVADHSRAITFLIADGVTPSNESRGYILRRILRRAIRFSRLLEIEKNFLNDISTIVINNYSGYYPELKERKGKIIRVINDEETKFSRTLKEGSGLLLEMIERLKKAGRKKLDPGDSFKLYETFGFPMELTVEILNEKGFSLDVEEFNKYMKIHAERSKSKKAFDKKISPGIELFKKISKEIKSEFTGYQEYSTDAIVKFILKKNSDKNISETDIILEGEEGEIILDQTPFYGEKGGQAGDKGIIRINGKAIFEVKDTQIPVEGIIIQSGILKEGIIKKGDKVKAEIDINFRKNISKNHTSTHILHWALRTVFGKDVAQSGSFVGKDRFRFDYSIAETPSQKDLNKVERIINEKIQKNDTVRCFETTRDYAEEIGTIALFGEKYGKYVRVVEIDDYSRELCGGIHVKRTGEIGILKILSDSSIGANIRRIEAITGLEAYDFLNKSYSTLKEVSASLDTESNRLKEKVEEINANTKRLQDDLNFLQIKAIVKEILSKNKNIEDRKKPAVIKFNFTESEFNINIDKKSMGIIGDEIINKLGNRNAFIIFGNILKEKPLVLLHSTDDLVKKNINCSDIAKDIGKILNGGGGGKPGFATVGGSDKNNLKNAIEKAEDIVLEKLSL